MAEMIYRDTQIRGWKPTSDKIKPGLHPVACDGARGLSLRLAANGSMTWVFRFKLHGQARQITLGSYPHQMTLAQAQEKARKLYAKVKSGVDPIEQGRKEAEAKKAAVARRIAFEKYARQYMENRQKTFKQSKKAKEGDEPKLSKQAQLWNATLETYAFPYIGKILVNDITEQDVQAMLEPIYNTKRETARKVVQRVGAIIGSAIDKGLRDREKLNPARPDAHASWRTEMNAIRADAAGRRGKHPAVPVSQAAEWFAKLREKGGMGARAVEFLALTGVRSGEVRAATWANVDIEKRVWTIPVEDSKTSRDPNRKPHVVPLSREAVALLDGLPRRAGVPLVFPAARDGQLSDMTLSKVMRDLHADAVAAGGEGWLDTGCGRPAVPHGLRATFSTWAAARRSEIEHETAEAVLAHAVGGTTSLAYQRGNYFEQRVPVMQAWADWLMGRTAAPAQDDPLAAALAVLREAGLSAADIAARLAPAQAGNVVPIRKGAA